MKKYLSLSIFLIINTISYSQIKFGIKTGGIFGYDGSLKQSLTNIKESNAKNSIGWQAGIFTQFTISSWIIQPEVYFSEIKNDFKYSSQEKINNTSQHLEIPVLIGKKILENGRIYLGPVFSTSLNESFSLDEFRKIKSDDFSISGQIGAGINIYSLTLDLRYEFGVDDKSIELINERTNQNFLINKKPNSLLIGIGYIF